MPAIARKFHTFSGVFTILAAILATFLGLTIASRMCTFRFLVIGHDVNLAIHLYSTPEYSGLANVGRSES
jgi:hypothetical protein